MNPNAAAFALILKQREAQSSAPPQPRQHGQSSWNNQPQNRQQPYGHSLQTQPVQQPYYPPAMPMPMANGIPPMGLGQQQYVYPPQMLQPQMYQQPPMYQTAGMPNAFYPSMPLPMGANQPYQPMAPMYPPYQQYQTGSAMPYAAPPQYPPAPAILPFQQQLNAYSNKTSHAYNQKPASYPHNASANKKPSIAPVVAAPPAAGEWYCEPCDKEFTQLLAYDAHMGTHETCKHPGCSFNATRKVVMAHFHGAHGQFSGSGYKMIDVEGQKFRVLLGQSPEEIAQWRAERRKKFPSAEAAEAKKAELDELIAAGGIDPKVGKFGNKDRNNREKTTKKRTLDGDTSSSAPNKVQKVAKIGEEGETIADGEDQVGEGGDDRSVAETENSQVRKCFQFGRGRCKNGDSCTFSHAFEPQMCEYFLRGFCKRGFKCFNIHDNQARLANKESRMALKNNPSSNAGADGEGAEGTNTEGSPSAAKTAKTGTNERKNASKDANRKNKADKDKDGAKPLKRGELHLPPPLDGGERGTLWKKLLEDEIGREENVVLQCLRFLVQNNFLDEADKAL